MRRPLSADLALALRLIEAHGILGIAALSLAGLVYLPLFAVVRALKSIVEVASLGRFTVTRAPVVARSVAD